MSAVAPIAVIGLEGQVARALRRIAAERGMPLFAGGRSSADITDARSLETFLKRIGPGLVINAAAYTAVDKAEGEPEAAFRLNAEGPARLAQLCAGAGVPLIHISTDYVFGGTGGWPRLESDPIAPAGVYAASKAAGESAIRDNLGAHVILRTAWVYDESGQNFLRTMLRLAETREEVGVVDDQRGSPTYAGDLAGAILDIASRPRDVIVRNSGTYHVTNSGETTWADFARAIFDGAGRRGFRTARVKSISTAEYVADAAKRGVETAFRPAYSVLDTTKIKRDFGIRLPSWQDALERCLTRMQPVAAAGSR